MEMEGLNGIVWPLLAAIVIRVRETANSFNDVKKFGRHAELFFVLLKNMRRKTDPIEPGHVSIESPIFSFPFARLPDMRLSARSDALCQEALNVLPWLCEWPSWR